MRIIRTAILTGAAALALVGAAGFAATKAPAEHVINVALPDGSIAQLHYTGDVAPQVVVTPVAVPVSLFDTAFGGDSPFAMFDRIAADMDRQADAMFRQVAAMSTQPGSQSGLTAASFGNLPAGMVSYSFVSTSSGAGTCSQSVQVMSAGTGQQPRVVSQSSGNCGSGGAAPTPTLLPAAPAADTSPAVTPVKLDVKDAVPAKRPTRI